MTELERTLWTTLVELNAAVSAMKPGRPCPDVQRLLSCLDDLTGRLPRDTAPDLLHYLHRKSYQKARLWLEARDAGNERGPCRQ
jgi:hypothetical protein